MVQRDDVVTALYKAIVTPAARDKTLNIRRRIQLADHRSPVRRRPVRRDRGADGDGGVPVATTNPGWVDWYDTEVSQQLLGYQEHSYPGLPRHAARGGRPRLLEDDC